jgi:type II secretory pathway pseudopilin PulG
MPTAFPTATGNPMRLRQPPQQGVTLIGLLFVIAGISIGMTATATLWSTVSQREKEQELLFIGNQYRQAIESFWMRSAGVQRLPASFDELLKDPRYPNTVRHLRRIYRDPITGNLEWGTVKGEDGGITGVYSLSTVQPMKRANFPAIHEDFKQASSYQQWIFRFDENAARTNGESSEVITDPEK